MSKHLQAVRGMNDILPSDSPAWQLVEAIIQQVCQRYGYLEIRFPIVEKTTLFKRSVGEVTDIVEKEMYTWDDKSDESLSLRPEGTAGCVRAGIEHGLLYNQTQRLWYMGPFFRRERPQKGRYRQFNQCGVEYFGVGTPDADAEVILVSKRLLNDLGLLDHVRLELNTLGSKASREAHRVALVDYLTAHQAQLDDDSQRRLLSNPLRILDSKNPDMQALIEAAPQLIDYLDTESSNHFEALKQYLDNLGIAYTLNPRLVRGLDYYCHTVFEWVTDSLGAQGTVCAGGRYDGLVEQLGGKATPAMGFALGLERIILMLQSLDVMDLSSEKPDIYFITIGDTALRRALSLAETCRDQLPDIKIVVNGGGGKFQKQLSRANQSGATHALILDDEAAEGKVTLKYLREDKPQKILSQEDLLTTLYPAL